MHRPHWHIGGTRLWHLLMLSAVVPLPTNWGHFVTAPYSRGTQTADRGPPSGPRRRFWWTMAVASFNAKSNLKYQIPIFYLLSNFTVYIVTSECTHVAASMCTSCCCSLKQLICKHVTFWEQNWTKWAALTFGTNLFQIHSILLTKRLQFLSLLCLD